MAKKSGVISNVKGATVFIDKNGDGVWNEGEVKAVADDSGAFKLEGKGAELKGMLVATGGTNLTTGVANTETFKAPQATKVVNSLTTLVAQLAKEEGLSMGKAMSEVKEALGIKLNILTKDPATIAETGKAGSSAVSSALAALEVQKQIDTVLKLGTSTLAGASTGTSAATLNASLLTALVEKVVSGAPLDLTSSTLVAEVLTSAATTAGLSAAEVTKVTTLATDAASVITASTTKIAESIAAVTELGKAATTTALDAALTKVESVETVAATVSGALETAAAGGSLTTVVGSYTGTALDGLVTAPPAPPTTDPVTPPSSGGGGGSPSPTFTVTNTAGVVTFDGTATGIITFTISGMVATFSRGGVTASTTVDFSSGFSKITVGSGQVLLATAAQVTGKTIDGAGTVAIGAVESTLGADLSGITATRVTSAVTTVSGTPVILTGDFKFGKADVTVLGNGDLIIDSANMGDTAFTVSASASLNGKHTNLSGKTITGTGSVCVELAADTDVSTFSDGLTIKGIVSDGSVDISNNSNLGKIDQFFVGKTGQTYTLTMTAAQASGKEINNNNATGNVTITGLAAGTDLSKVNVSGTATGTVTTSVNLTNVDLSKLTALTLKDNTVTATVSPQQYADWKDVVTKNSGTFVSSDTTAPTTSITHGGAYDEGSNTITLTGSGFNTLLEPGENATTDIKGRLDWTKFTWDINYDDNVTENVSFALSDISSAKATSDETLVIKLTNTKGAALESTSGYGAVGNADGLSIVTSFARDLSGNVAPSGELKSGGVTITVPTPPSAPSGLALDASDDTGTSNSDGITKNTNDLTITGSAEAGSTVTIYATDGTTVLGTGTATGGNFSIDVNLSEGEHSLSAKTTTDNGTSIASSALAITVDTTPPALDLSNLSIANDGFISSTEKAFVGISTSQVITEPSISLSISADDTDANTTAVTTTTTSYGTSSDLPGGMWASMNLSSLSAGAVTFTITGTDAAGNSATDSLRAPYDVTAISGGITYRQDDNSIHLWGGKLSGVQASNLDWSKFSWTLANAQTLTLTADDIQQVDAQENVLVITIKSDKATTLEGNSDYRGTAIDTITVQDGFLGAGILAGVSRQVNYYDTLTDLSGNYTGDANPSQVIVSNSTGFNAASTTILGGGGQDELTIQSGSLDLTNSTQGRVSGFEFITLTDTNPVSLTLGAYRFTEADVLWINTSSNGVANIDASFLVENRVNVSTNYSGATADILIGSAQNDQLVGNAGADTYTGNGGSDAIGLGTSGGFMSGETDTDTVVYLKSTDGGFKGDQISAFTAGSTNSDILKFIDAGNTTGNALDLTGTATKGFNKGTFSGLTAGASDNIWVITDAQSWDTAAAIDAAIAGKAHASMTGGLVLVCATQASPYYASVWYVGTPTSGTDGSDVKLLASLVGIQNNQLDTLTTENFAVA